MKFYAEYNPSRQAYKIQFAYEENSKPKILEMFIPLDTTLEQLFKDIQHATRSYI